MFLLECQLIRGEGSKLLGKRKKKTLESGGGGGGVTEFRFCVLNADTAELSGTLMREGGAFQPLNSSVLTPSRLNNELRW